MTDEQLIELQITLFEMTVAQVTGPVTEYLKSKSYTSADEFDQAMARALDSWTAVRNSVQIHLLRDFRERGVISQEFFDAAIPEHCR